MPRAYKSHIRCISRAYQAHIKCISSAYQEHIKCTLLDIVVAVAVAVSLDVLLLFLLFRIVPVQQHTCNRWAPQCCLVNTPDILPVEAWMVFTKNCSEIL